MYVNIFPKIFVATITGWRKPIGYIICIGHFPQESSSSNGSYARKKNCNLRRPMGLHHPGRGAITREDCCVREPYFQRAHFKKSSGNWQPTDYNKLPHTLQHTATHCNALQHTAPHCKEISLPEDFWQMSRLQTTTHCHTHCNTLQQTAIHSATHCITLQHTATHLHHTAKRALFQGTSDNCPAYTLQHTVTHNATHCNTLQHTATHCNTLHHTATRALFHQISDDWLVYQKL